MKKPKKVKLDGQVKVTVTDGDEAVGPADPPSVPSPTRKKI
jgi:hypothetical protein